jgi:hypothetical protein
MRCRFLTGLALMASLASAADVTSVSLSGGSSGLRIRFGAREEILSRVVATPNGLRIDLLGASSELRGIHALEANPWFKEIRCTPVQTERHRLLRFEFATVAGVVAPDVLHREWNGRDLDFVIDRKAVSRSFDATWIASAPSEQQPALASLEASPALDAARIAAQGDLETIYLGFNAPPAKATLAGGGKQYTIALGKARVSAKFSGIKGAGLLVSSIASSKKAGETVLTLTLEEAARSVLLSRSGDVVQVRIVRAKPLEGFVTWNSKSSKAQQLVRTTLPSDEVATVAAAARTSAVKGGVFTPEGSAAAFSAQTDANNVGAGLSGNAGEVERLEAERRKSREFVEEQARKADAQQMDAEMKNRVVYNTFGIRDPFIPLQPDDVEGGLNIDQMRVVGIIYSPTRPMAVLEHVSQGGLSVALREGDAIQSGRVLKILRDQVVFVLEEFGVTRQFTLKLQVPKGEKS